MLRLATVFSGIGAIEHALKRMGIEHEIVFASDNGDVDIFKKKIDINFIDIKNELERLERIIDNKIFCIGYPPSCYQYRRR